MTREEKLYSMRGTELIQEAEKLGVKVSKKGNSLKESKAGVIQRILKGILKAEAEEEEKVAVEETVNQEPETEAEIPMIEDVQEQENNEEPAEENEPVEVKEPAEKKEKRARKLKKTFEELVAEIPICAGNIRYVKATNGDVLVKQNKRRIFRYDGRVLIATNEKMFTGCEYNKCGSGFIIKNATTDIMRKVFANI